MEGRSAAYRGATREEAERKYHDAARTAAVEGYAPTSEDWSSAMGEQVLTVTYAYLPEQAPAVLAALPALDPEPHSPAPAGPLPPLQRSTDPRAVAAWRTVMLALEGRFPVLKGRLPLAAGIGVLVVAVVFWFFVLNGKPGGTAGTGPTQPPAATQQPTPSSRLATSDVMYTASAPVGGNIRLRFTVTNLGRTTSAPIRAQVSGIRAVADATDCVPACAKSDALGDLYFDFDDALAPGLSVTYEIDFVATQAGVAEWSMVLQEDQSLDFYKGDGTITIK